MWKPRSAMKLTLFILLACTLLNLGVFQVEATPNIRLGVEAYEGGSCPFLYTWDGSSYVIDNDIYSVGRELSREYTDYLKIETPVVLKEGSYSFNIANVPSEVSYTDLIRLLVVDHPSDVEVGVDSFGNAHSYRNPVQPDSALQLNGKEPVIPFRDSGVDVKPLLLTKDGTGVKLFHNNSIILDFSSVDISVNAKLVLRVDGFETEGESSLIPATPSIRIETLEGGAWVTRHVFYPKEYMAQGVFDLKPFLAESQKVRLLSVSCRTDKYHLIDYAGLDTSQDAAISTVLNPLTASVGDTNVLSSIASSDDAFAVMTGNDAMTVTFPFSQLKGSVRDFVLISEGYYRIEGNTYKIYTWDGSAWQLRYSRSWEASDTLYEFDLSAYLPDLAGEYKVRVENSLSLTWPQAYIDYVYLKKDGVYQNLWSARESGSYDISGYVRNSDDNRWNAVNRWAVIVFGPNRPPVAEAGGPYTGNEASPTTFNAAGSSDPDASPLQYRWDFNNDGTWDTAFSSTPSASYTWPDETTGTARVQVYDGEFYSTDTCTYTVNNIAPQATLTGGGGYTENYILATNYNAQSYYLTITGNAFTTSQMIDDKGSSCYNSGGIGDFDNDGDLDALVGDSSNTWFYRKTGSGKNFATATSIDSTVHQYRMDFAEADYNNDGKLDAVMADYGSTYFTVYLGRGDGTFTRNTFTAPSNIIGMDSADFNRDGKADFAAANWGSPTMSIYLGNGDGTFRSPISLNIGQTSWGVAAGDFNGDSKADLIIGYNPVNFYRGNGDGTFSAPVSLGFSAYGLAEGDWNADGKLDIISTDGSSVYYRSGNGDGTFTSRSQIYVSSVLYGVATGSAIQVVEAAEGSLIQLTAGFTDPGWLDIHAGTVNWGDGTSPESITFTEEHTQPDSTGTATISHSYGKEGTYTITLTVSDGDGGSGSTTKNVKITNVPPVADAGVDQTVDEGSTATFDGSGTTDPGFNDVLTYSWNFGDGSSPLSGVNLVNPTHIYADNGAYTVTLTVTDGGAESSTDTTRVTVLNVPPTVNVGPDRTVDENSLVTLEGSATDPGTSDTLTYEWDLDYNGSFTVDKTGSSVTNIWTDDWEGDVALRVTDKDGGVVTDVAHIVVRNVAPLSEAGIDREGDEGSVISFSSAASDQSPDDTLTYAWDFGDGATASGTLTPTHTYADNGVYTVTLRVTDDDGGVGSDTLTATISNVAPSVEAPTDTSGEEGSSIAIGSIAFTDPGLDTFTAAIDWGDGSSTNLGTVTSAITGQTHTYADNGAYVVSIKVTDDDGGVGTDSLTITVSNTAPIAGASNSGPVDEGSAATITASQTDLGILDTFKYSFDWDNDGVYEIAEQPSPSAQNTWLDDGTYTVTIKVTDKDGGVGTAATTVTVRDLSPAASFTSSPQGQAESSPVQFTDQSTSYPDEITSWSWIFGDGATSTNRNPSHTYADEGSYTVELIVIDDDGSADIMTATVNVINVAPAAEAGPGHTLDEGDMVTFSGAASDPGVSDVLTYTWNFGDGSTSSSGVDLTAPTHFYADDGTYSVTLAVSDGDGGTDTDTLVVTVNNVAPTVNAGEDKTADEGSQVHLSGSFTDPGADTHTITWNFGDGATVSGTLTPTHIYADNGAYIVTLTVVDDDGGVGTDSLTLTVNNVPPVAGQITAPVDPVKINTQITAMAPFTDAGTGDTHTSMWNWGDGTSSAGTITEQSGSGKATGTHSYTAPGIYTIMLTVTDDDGGVGTAKYEYVVVYDPLGSFVTGGGWINSPAGAYKADASMTGKATFGFVAKYVNGANVPKGNAEFVFHAGGLNFHSSSIQWLVVAGTKVQFKGEGTINGVSGYGFMISAKDGQISGGGGVDCFRIKIWELSTGRIVYDNQMNAATDATPTTSISGGSIVIHK